MTNLTTNLTSLDRNLVQMPCSSSSSEGSLPQLRSSISTNIPSTETIVPLTNSPVVQFVGHNVTTSYSVANSLFTLGFHTQIGLLSFLRRRAFEERLISTVSVERATEIATLIIAKFNVPVTILRNLEFAKKEDEGSVYVASELQIHDLRPMRKIIRWCDEQGLISNTDRALLNPMISEIKAKVRHQDSLVGAATQAQIDIVRALSEPYIEGIIEKCATITTPEQLTTWTEIDGPILQRNLAICLLIGSCQEHITTLYGEKFQAIGYGETFECGEHLQKIYKGNSNIEGALTQAGLGVLSLQTQREILIQFMEEKVIAAFGAEPASHIDEKIKKSEAHIERLQRQIQSKRGDRKTALSTQIEVHTERLNGLKTQRAASLKETHMLSALRTKLFAEGYSLDTMPWLESGIHLNPFAGVIDALQDNFGTAYPEYHIFSPKHAWTTPEGITLKGDAARARFAEMKQEVEASISAS